MIFFSHVMPLALHWYHMPPVASSMKPMISLCQVNQHDILGHVMPFTLTLLSCNVNGILN